MGRGGGGSGGSHGGGGGHFNYGSSRGGGHSRGGGRSSSNYSPVYRTSYYRPMTPLGGTLGYNSSYNCYNSRTDRSKTKYTTEYG